MADAKLTALTAASALAAADLFYASQGGASRKVTGAQLLALVGTAYVPLAGGTMTGALTIASGSLAVSAPAFTITQTWNGVGQRFDGVVMDFTNTNSGNSYPYLIRVNGSEISYLTKTGDLFCGNLRTVSSSGSIGFSTSGNVFLYRDGDGQLAMRNGANAQRIHIYGTSDGTPGSNYQRLVLSANGTTGVTIAAEGLGTPGANQDITLTPGGTGRVVIGNVGIYPSSGLVQVAQVDSSIYGSSLQLKAYTSEDVIFYEGSTVIGRFLAGGGLQLSERTAPSAPATNSVRIFAQDNGAGKTQLMVQFATGAAQQISIEP